MWVEANSGSGGGGGGSETETTLWTNPSPSASFNSQTVTLSDGWDNYSKIVIYYKRYYNSSSSAEMGSVIYRASDIANWITTSANGIMGSIAAIDYNSAMYARIIFRGETNSKIAFGNAYRLGSTSTSTNYCIPTQITGIN